MHQELDTLWFWNDKISQDLTIKNNAIKAAVLAIIYKSDTDKSVVYLIERIYE